MPQLPSLEEERKLRAQGYHLIAGIDEVGRGALAGPVAAAAVILPCQHNIPCLASVRDSKMLSLLKRQSQSLLIQGTAVAWGVGMISSDEIDERGIIEATRLAMHQALCRLSYPADFLLIDALTLPHISLPQKGIVHGDRLCLSIACASIIAKVARDQYMVQLDKLYPGYGLAHHKGYATKEHLLSLQQLGPCPIHRKSFAPVRRLI
jgi:ribonuclease HII